MALFDIVSQVADKYTLRLTGDKGSVQSQSCMRLQEELKKSRS